MANFLSQVGQGAAGSLGNAAVPLLGGLLGGLFGGKQKLSPEARFQMNIAHDLQRFSKSAPMSDPGERAAFANQRAQLGEQQRNQEQGLYSQLSPNITGAPADMAQSIAAQQTSQQMALQAQSMMDALQQRRQALMQAAGVAQGVGPRQEQGGGLAPMLGQMAQMYTQYQAARQGQTQYQQFLDALTGKTARSGGAINPPSGPAGFMGMNQAPQSSIQSAVAPSTPPGMQGTSGMGMSRGGMAPGNMGNNVPMQPPMGAGYGIPSNNSTLPSNSPDLFSQLQGGWLQGNELTNPRGSVAPWQRNLMQSGVR